MTAHIWLDGQLLPADAPHLSVADRGFQLGDGVFETLRARRGVVIECNDHLARLHESAHVLAIRLPADETFVRGMRELLDADGLAADGREGAPGDAAIRVTISRGPILRRGLLPAGFDTTEATVAIQAWPYLPPPDELLARGVSAIPSAIRRDPRSPISAIKTTSRADYVYAKLEAQRAGADDAIFLTTDGEISEATTANVWVIRADRLATPPADAAILAGTTRTWLLAHAADVGLRAEERELRPVDLLGADEAFLSSSVAGVVPLTRFDGRPIGSGVPGVWTVRLRDVREGWIDKQSLARGA